MNLSPIVLFVYNRPDHTKRTVEALQKNNLANDSDLFIFSDGPKNEEQTESVNEVRNYIKNITGFKTVTITEKDKNYGLANSVIAGVTEIVNKFGKIIVMEDDLITSPFFLEYMNEALDYYENEEKVISISGYIYPVKKNLPDTFFLRLTSSWGWATWKKGWNLFEKDGKKLLDEIENKKLINEFNIGNSYGYSNMLNRQIQGLNSSWAIRWYASSFLANKLTLYPGKSMAKNIGFDGTGRHSSNSSVYNVNLNNKKITLIQLPVEENKMAFSELKKYFNSSKPNILKRVVRKLIKIISK